jgi:hypothetical protein
MATELFSKPSFSVRQRWGIFFSVIISIAAVSALVVMINYLGARYYLAFPWSTETRNELSPQTHNILNSLTNEINVVIYYDHNNVLCDRIKGLLDDYCRISTKIHVKKVDYLVDAGDAEKIKDSYSDFMGPGEDTNVVIFSSSFGTNVVRGEELGQFEIAPDVTEDKKNQFRNRLINFDGEEKFTSAIFRLTNPKPVRAYFLEDLKADHLLNGKRPQDYQQFKTLLEINNIDVTNLPSVGGTNGIPGDCKLLVIAGPGILTHSEIDNIQRYLDQGGHLFVLFNYSSKNINTGLEPLLTKWGITVGRDIVHDLKYHTDEGGGNDVVVNSFNKQHPVVTHLRDLSLELVLPRAVGTNSTNQGSDTPAAQELAWTSANAATNDSLVAIGKPLPLMAAVEKGEIKGIMDQGTTRILVVGDSYFLDNQMIAAARNRAFAGYAVNWLVGQTQMLQGLGPHTIHEYRIMATDEEVQTIRWIFLAAMPGAILMLGGLVWLRRRR